MVTMASRAASAAFGARSRKPPSSYRSAWGDFSASHAPAARLAQYNGLLREFPLGSMNPWRNATRAEAVALLFNLMGTDPRGLNGRFLGDSTDLVRFFREHNAGDEKFTISVDKLAKLYVLLGRRFGVRADMAWAQMVHETNFGRYTGDVQPAQNNFAGIGATGGVPGQLLRHARAGRHRPVRPPGLVPLPDPSRRPVLRRPSDCDHRPCPATRATSSSTARCTAGTCAPCRI